MTNLPKQGQSMNSPALEQLSLASLVEQMKEMAPYYTPEWRFSPEDPDPGSALFFLAAAMLQDNAKRLNRTPLKNFIAFLNMLQVRQQPTRPAQGQVIFRLNEGVYEPVWIPVGTQVNAPDPDGDDDLIFETAQPLLVTPSLLTDLYNVSSSQDRIVQLTDQYQELLLQEPSLALPMYDTLSGEDLQQHALYLRHDDLFLITHPAIVRIEWEHTLKRFKQIELAQAFSDLEWLEWSYPSGGEWKSFDHIENDGNHILLHKRAIGSIDETEVFGVSGRWIRCQLRAIDGAASPLLARNLETDKISVQSYFNQATGLQGIPPGMLFYNDIELDGNGCYPFGDIFAPYSSFYLSSEEVFGKPLGEITLEFDLRANLIPLRTAPDPEINWRMVMKRHELEKKEPPRISILKVQWEYWNGTGWIRIPGTQRYEELFVQPSLEEPARQSVTFTIPEDNVRTFVNAQYDYWIRVRVLSMDQLFAPETVYVSPWVENIKLLYGYDSRSFALQTVTSLNNMEYRDRTIEAMQGGKPFRPFESLLCEFPAFYAGFNAPLRKGPIRLYFSMHPAQYAKAELPWVEWEYWGREGTVDKWLPLKVGDETNGFTESGTVQFLGPANMISGIWFGKERYWLRAINRDHRFDREDIAFPTMKRVDLNSVKVQQQLSIHGETPELIKGRYVLSATPVISEEVWVDETNHLSEHEIALRQEADPETMELILDSEGLVQRVWLRYSKVDTFLGSGSSDRHYIMDAATGTLQFGDGIRGMEPPNEGPDKIRVNYKVTAGKMGNIEAGRVNSLQSSIAFVESVYNAEPMGGGCDTELLEKALTRGPQRLKHRDRAVTAEDFEWLAREAYPDLAKVRCLPNRNARLEREIGAITMVILPQGGHSGHPLFPGIKRQVERYLSERAVGGPELTSLVQVIEPAYLEVSVAAVVAVQTMEEALSTEQAILEKLQSFLHPVAGQMDGRGWEIGEPIHLSVFHSLFKSIHSVQFVEKLYMSIVKIEDGLAEEIDPQRQTLYPHALVMNGQHRITVVTV